MLEEYLISSENDGHTKLLCECLQELKFRDLIDINVDDIIDAIKIRSFILEDDDRDYELIVDFNSNNVIRIKVMKKDSPEYTDFYFNTKGLISLTCYANENGDMVEWNALWTKNMLLFDNGEMFKFSEIKENIFQYETISPLAGLLLEISTNV